MPRSASDCSTSVYLRSGVNHAPASKRMRDGAAANAKSAFNMSYQAPEKRANALEGIAALVATESSARAVACAARCQLRDVSTQFLAPECRQVLDNVGERALVGPNLPNVSAMPLSVPVST